MDEKNVLAYIIQQGVDWNEQLNLFEDDKGTIPTDLTGATIDLQIFRSLQSLTPFIELSTTLGTIQLIGYPAQINWKVPDTQTALYVPAPGFLLPEFAALNDPTLAPFGFYNLRAKDVYGSVLRELSGPIALSRGSNTSL